MVTYTRQSGEPVTLGTQLGAAGGEGAVYAINGHPDLAAKVYHQSTPARIAKVQAMLANAPEDPTSAQGHLTLAWPVDLLIDGTGTVPGFLMPRLNTTTALTFINLYNAKTRQRIAPAFTWQYLLRTARNLASALASLHDRGYVVGDLNESNIFITNTAQVTLIDCDSVQVRDPNGTVYRCTVGRDEYTPAELQGVDLALTDRLPAHDAFGLGVLIYLLLMEGQHPFAGVWQGGGNPPELAERIRVGACPFVPGKQAIITPSPTGLPFATLPPGLQTLFRQCFGDGHVKPVTRPTALDWFVALVDAERHLTHCPTNDQHVFSDHLTNCPWCERMARGLPDPFPPPQPGVGSQAPLPPVTMSVLRSVSSIPIRPTPAPPPPRAPVVPPTVAAPAPMSSPLAARRAPSSARRWLPVAVGGSLLGLIVLAVIAAAAGGGSSEVTPAVAGQVMQVATVASATVVATATTTSTPPPPTPAPTPTPVPTPQPVSSPAFAVNSLVIGCHEAPDASAPVVAQRAPGAVQALNEVFRPGNGETWHREAGDGCWVRTSPGPVQLATSVEQADTIAADYRPAAPPQPVTAALSIQTSRARSAKAGQGVLRVVITRLDGPLRSQNVDVYRARPDVRGTLVRGDHVTGGRTDNTGTVALELAPGEYVVASSLPGYNWGVWSEGKGHAGVPIRAGEETALAIGLGKLTFTVAAVDRAISSQSFDIYTQKRDARGQAVKGDHVTGGRTDNTGVVSFDLVPGPYIALTGLPGYNWGNSTEGKGDTNIVVTAGQQIVMDLRPGQLAVVTQSSTSVDIYTQKRDANGAPAQGDHVTGGRTDNTGTVRFDLVSGTYAVRINGRTSYNVVVRRGDTTRFSP